MRSVLVEIGIGIAEADRCSPGELSFAEEDGENADAKLAAGEDSALRWGTATTSTARHAVDHTPPTSSLCR